MLGISVLLESVLHNSRQDNEEKQTLKTAIYELKQLIRECDDKIAESASVIELRDLQSKLRLGRGMNPQNTVYSDQADWDLVHRGNLLEKHDKGFSLIETHAFVFDRFMVLAKVTANNNTEMPFKRYDMHRPVSHVSLYGFKPLNILSLFQWIYLYSKVPRGNWSVNLPRMFNLHTRW